MFVRFYMIHERDRQTHTETPHDGSDMDVGWIHPWVGLGRVGLGRKFSRFGGLGWVGFIYAHGNFFVNLTIYTLT